MKTISDKTIWFLVFTWSVLACSALYGMADYGAEEGIVGTAPEQWPESLPAELTPEQGKPTVILFAHPLCPCTRSTLWELESLGNRLFGLFNLHVLFYEPEDPSSMPDLWAATSLKQIASRIPATRLHKDVESRLAKHFGAYTSGHVLLYDTSGRLQFAGGITPSRGHVGSNPGRATLISSILSDDNVNALSPVLTPVFGCSLHEESDGDRKRQYSEIADFDLSNDSRDVSDQTSLVNFNGSF